MLHWALLTQQVLNDTSNCLVMMYNKANSTQRSLFTVTEFW